MSSAEASVNLCQLSMHIDCPNQKPSARFAFAAGLVRFASEQYSSSKSSRGHATMHLTNYSINKTAKGFQQPGAGQSPKKPKAQQQDQTVGQQDDAVADAAECEGDADEPSDDTAASKWSFGQLAQYLQSQGHHFKPVWNQVQQLVVHQAHRLCLVSHKKPSWY